MKNSKSKPHIKSKPNSPANFFDSLALVCKDIDGWPDSWAGDKDDVIIGLKILSEFKYYLVNLIEKGFSTRTVKKHASYLWALGGEIIRDTNEHGVDSKLSGREIILKYIHSAGGPYWRHATNEADHHKYDSACSRLYKSLICKDMNR